MPDKTSPGWLAYGALIETLSWLHYVVVSPLGKSDEGGAPWLAKRRNPAVPNGQGKRRIWIHAVSAGEAKVAELLRRDLLALDPAVEVVLSATTYSGFARVQRVAGEGASFIMPLDTLPAQGRVFEQLRPDLLVLVESEFWPAQFAAAEAAGVPVVVVNATLSARSFAAHQRFPAVARRTVLKARRIYPQDPATLERYHALGVPVDRLELSGNLKLAPLGSLPSPDRSRPTITFGSVHAEELDALTPAVKALRQRRPDYRVVLVPRYPGRIAAAELEGRFGPELAIVEDLAASGAPLVWLDRMGTLADAYARSEVGVVCGTFAPIGGHDLAEPLHLGAASVYGPHVERQQAMHAALQPDCAVQVGGGELVEAVLALLEPERREGMLARFRGLSLAAGASAEVIARQLLGFAKEA